MSTRAQREKGREVVNPGESVEPKTKKKIIETCV